MNLKKVTTMAMVMLFVSFPVMADSDHSKEEAGASTSTKMPMASGQMPMMGNQPGNMPMTQGQGMPMMQMMQERHAMMQAHMQKMETHMANIEALLEQLVELQKRK